MRFLEVSRFVLLAALTGVSLFAADVTGKWETTFTTPNGDTRKGTMNLKADGGKLTGTMESQRGSTEIQDGKVDGDNISFVVVRNFQGNEMKFAYKGKVAGDEMKLTLSAGEREMEMRAKRMK